MPKSSESGEYVQTELTELLNFDIESHVDGDRAVVNVRGDLDLQVAPRVAQELTSAEAGNPSVLIVDLSGLSFMDSSGMGVIAAAHARAVEADRRFVVVGPPYSVRRAFELSGFDEVITVVEDIADV